MVPSLLDKGIGYYSLECRETYDILIKRIDKMIKSSKQSKGMAQCCLCITLIGILCISEVSKNFNKKIEELEDAKTLATARRDSANPSADLTLPKGIDERMTKYRRDRTDGTTGGHYYDDSAYYAYAAACGAGGGYYDGGGGGGDGGDGGA